MKPVFTSSLLSKYELAKLVGILSIELSQNRTTFFDNQEDLQEYAKKKILKKDYDVVISRHLPNNLVEEVHLKELYTEHLE